MTFVQRAGGKNRGAESAEHMSSGELLYALLIGLMFTGYPAISFLSIPLNIEAERSRLITMPFRAVVLVLGTGLLISAWRNRRLVSLNGLHILFICFWSLYGIRLVYETLYNAELLVFKYTEYLAYGFGICIASTYGLFTRMSLRVANVAPRFIWLLALIAIITGIVLRRGELGIDRRAQFGTLNPISYGQCSVTLILLSAYLALTTKELWLKVLFAVGSLPGFVVVTLAASRGPVLCLLGGLAVLFVLAFRLGHKLRAIFGTFVVVIGLWMGLDHLIQSQSLLTTRFSETAQDFQGGGELERPILWSAALAEYVKHPVLGAGLEIPVMGYPHNLTIEALLTTGPLGALLFIALQVFMIRGMGHTLRFIPTTWAALLGVQYLVHSQFSGSLCFAPEFWATVLLQATCASLATPQPAMRATGAAAAPWESIARMEYRYRIRQ